MRTYILRRLAHTVPVLIGAATLVFLALRLIPGDPAVAMAGEKASVAEIERIREQLGLNQPLPVQYALYLERTFTLQLGRSIRTGGDIREELITSFGPTIELTVAAMLVALVIGLPAGILAAIKRRTGIEYLAMILSLVGISYAVFCLKKKLIFWTGSTADTGRP